MHMILMASADALYALYVYGRALIPYSFDVDESCQERLNSVILTIIARF